MSIISHLFAGGLTSANERILAIVGDYLICEVKESDKTMIRVSEHCKDAPEPRYFNFEDTPLIDLRMIVYYGTGWWSHSTPVVTLLHEKSNGGEPGTFVQVEKAYSCGDDRIILNGVIAVRNSVNRNTEGAIRYVNELMFPVEGKGRYLQTVDSRILWDEPAPEGYEYESFSFVTTRRTCGYEEAIAGYEFRHNHWGL